MPRLIQTFIRDETGEDLIEYGLLSSFVAAVALASLVSDPLGLRPSIAACFRKAAEALYLAAQGDVVRL